MILSKPLQRLRKISQDGAPHFIQPIRNVNRLEHSIGVWYLSHKFGRPIEEQIACLLYDIPHTAFSHVIDFVMKDAKHEFHEKFAEKIIMDSEIPQILKKHKVSIDKVLDKEKFVLLEKDLPDISFDRWDYFMRDGYTLGFLPKLVVDNFLENIYLKNNRLFFSEALKLALDKKIISEEDFFTDDEVLMKKLKQAKIKQIDRLLDRLQPGREFIYSSKSKAEFFGPNKPRYVNTWVLCSNRYKRVSDLVPNLAYYFEQFKTEYKYLGVNQI